MQDANNFFPSAPSSSASSSRTVRAVPRQGGYYTPGLYMNPAGNATTESLNTLSTLSTITPSTYAGPIPPARTSSLAVRGRHQSGIPQTGLTIPPRMYGPDGHLPSVQVTHPTPTKRRTRRSAEHADLVGWDGSSTNNTLDVRVDSQDAGSTEREGEDEDVSEAERQREIQETRKARAREKGRERQRRKRERDKKAKEDARATGASSNPPTTALMTSTHLPIPPRNSSTASLPHTHMTPSIQPYPFTMSVPSSASSSYSPLPQPNFYAISPSTNASFASMSVSGQSSPGPIFSPAMSTPATEGTVWTDGSVVMDKRTKSRPPIPPIPVDKPHKPAKRRKSEPQPEEFRDGKPPEVGLGVMIDPTWQAPPSTERPKYRRTHSEGAAVLSEARARSSTPPPVSTAPSTYMTPAETSQAGAFFATTVLVALSMSGLGRTLEDQLGMGEAALEEIKGDLAGVFDRWRLAQGLRDVNLGVEMVQTLSTSTVDEQMGDDTITATMGSPQRQSTDTSFFTPAPARTRQGVPQSMPHFLQQVQPYESPHVPAEGGHNRTRSLSSASMAARGLVINPGTMQWSGEMPMQTSGSGSEGQSTSPTIQTPSTGQGSFPSAESLGMVASQNLGQTYGHLRSATEPQQRHYTTRPVESTRQTVETTEGSASDSTASTSSEWTGKGPSPLDSPLAMARRQHQSPMAPPPATMPRYQYRQGYPPPPAFAPMDSAYSTPHSQRNFRQVPFTPPTPVHQSDQNMNMMLSGNGDGMTMFYDPNMPGAYHDGRQQGDMGQG